MSDVQKTHAVCLRFTEHGDPIVSIPQDARLTLRISEDGSGQTALGREVSIEGNYSGLMAFGELIIALAEAKSCGCHFHIDDVQWPKGLRLPENTSLIVGQVVKKYKR